MAQLNVTSQAVATALRTAVSGSVVSAYRPEGATQLDITLVANDAQRTQPGEHCLHPVGTGTVYWWLAAPRRPPRPRRGGT